MPLPSNPLKATFPLLGVINGESFYFVGTGFFIDEDGSFLTAKHVFLDLTVTYAVAMINGRDVTTYPISEIQVSDRHDIAFGKAKDIKGVQPLKLADKDAPINLDIITTEYSGTSVRRRVDGLNEIVFNPYYRKGNVVSSYLSTFPEKEETLSLELSFPALKGASGAPVIVEQSGLVIGMILGNIQRELLPSQIDTVVEEGKYTEEIKYMMPSAKAINWKHIADFLQSIRH